MAGGRHVCAGEQRGGAARRQSGRGVRRDATGRAGGRGRRERERPGRRPDHHGGAAPGPGLHGPAVLEFDDRSVVAVPEASMALPPLARQRRHRASPRGVLRRGA